MSVVNYIHACGGYTIEGPANDHITEQLAWGVPYEAEALSILEVLVNKGECFLDVGAHIGNHAIYMAMRGATVLAIEPNHEALRYLESNVRLNQLEARVRVLRAAAWACSGRGHVVATNKRNTGACTVVDTPRSNEHDTPLIPIDSLALLPAAIKIDVEGAEAQVLEGAERTIAQALPALLIECHNGPRSVARKLSRWGYRRYGGSWAHSPVFLFLSQARHVEAITLKLRKRRQRLIRDCGRRLLRRVPGLPMTVGLVRGWYRSAKQSRRVLGLRWNRIGKPHKDGLGLVASLTSFPARIKHAWMAIETLLQQDLRPEAVVLVLADSQFPGRHLPWRIADQVRRGLQVLWTADDLRSYKKLLPSVRAYAGMRIITFDDDVLYPSSAVRQLVVGSGETPSAVVARRAWQVIVHAARLVRYTQWPPANQRTRAPFVFPTGVGGVLYPPGVLASTLLSDYQVAKTLCPTADDVWFWGVASAIDCEVRCLAQHDTESIIRLGSTPRLELVNRYAGQNDGQIARVVDYFSLHAKLGLVQIARKYNRTQFEVGQSERQDQPS